MSVLLLCAAPALRAEDLLIGGFWIRDAQVIAIADGKLTYQTNLGAQIAKPLTQIEAIRLSGYPNYQQGLEALAAGDAPRAVELLELAASRARTPWARAFIGRALWRAQAQAGDVTGAVRAYLDMARSGADPYFLDHPPTAAIRRLPDYQRAQVVRWIDAARPHVGILQRPYLDIMLRAAGESPILAAADPNEPAAPPPRPADSGLVLPLRMVDSEATSLLRAGRFDEALAQIERDLQESGDPANDLYLRGVALLHKADPTRDADAYKDAGLAFMRVLVYFPGSDFPGRNLVGGSLLELACVHDKLGRTDKAAELYGRAAAELDPDADPNLTARLRQLRANRP